MLYLSTEKTKRKDEQTLKQFMLIVRQLRKDLLFRRKEFSITMDIKEEIYIKFESTGKAAVNTLFRLLTGLAKLGVDINKLLSLKSVDEYNIDDLMNPKDKFMASSIAIQTKLDIRHQRQRIRKNGGSPFFFNGLTLEEIFSQVLDSEQEQRIVAEEETEYQTEQERMNKYFQDNQHLVVEQIPEERRKKKKKKK